MNEKNLSRYISRWLDGEQETSGRSAPFYEKIDDEHIFVETMMLNLRQNKGMRLHDVLHYIDKSKHLRFFDTFSQLQELALVYKSKDVIRLTPRGMALENEVVTKLLSV